MEEKEGWVTELCGLQASRYHPVQQTGIACVLSLPLFVCYLLSVLYYLCANLVTAEELTSTVIILINLSGVQWPI